MNRIEIGDDVYRELGQLVNDEICDSDFVDCIVETDRSPAFSGVLRLTAVIHRGEEAAPDYVRHPIVDIGPVWWEFMTFDKDGDECINDFQFSRLKKYLVE